MRRPSPSLAAVRPDGRRLLHPRPASVGLSSITSADSSALVKVGATTVLAGIKCELGPTPDHTPDQGTIAVHVELTPLCSPDTRPGRPSEVAQVLTEQLNSLLRCAEVVDLAQLCIDPGKAAWTAYVDLYVLDAGGQGGSLSSILAWGTLSVVLECCASLPPSHASFPADGALHDACLFAMLAALSSLKLQRMVVDEASGKIKPADKQEHQQQERVQLQVSSLPLSLTCGIYDNKLIVDTTADEEQLMGGLVTVTVDENGNVLGASNAVCLLACCGYSAHSTTIAMQ
jgi:exosome complex component RRP43